MRENEKQFKATMLAYLSSSEVTTNDLRVYARMIGVESPTMKKNAELREKIIAILSGELEPIAISTRGAPVKNKFINPAVLKKINQICEDYHIFDKYKQKKKENDCVLHNVFPKIQPPTLLVCEESANDESLAYNGQLVHINDVYYLIPLDCKKGNRILLSEKTVSQFDLREGDVIVCRVVKGETALVAREILSVNGFLVNSFTRSVFDEEIPCYPEESLKLGGVEEKTSLKYFDWILPIRKGQRACIVAPPKAGKSQILYDLAVAVQSGNTRTETFVLLVDQAPEAVGKFRCAFSNDKLVYTTYEDDAQFQVFAADFLLKRVKRLVEHGVDVVLFVDSLSGLAKAYNDTDASLGGKTLSGGVESKTLQYVKRFFGAARKLEKGGSLTIVGAISSDTGNPADELICGELSAIANFEVRLSDTLATKRIYPAIDHLQSKLDGGMATEEEQLLREKYLPKYGAEVFLNELSESKSKEALFDSLRKSMEI